MLIVAAFCHQTLLWHILSHRLYYELCIDILGIIHYCNSPSAEISHQISLENWYNGIWPVKLWNPQSFFYHTLPYSFGFHKPATWPVQRVSAISLEDALSSQAQPNSCQNSPVWFFLSCKQFTCHMFMFCNSFKCLKYIILVNMVIISHM